MKDIFSVQMFETPWVVIAVTNALFPMVLFE